jgi:Uma2 family endonuclease
LGNGTQLAWLIDLEKQQIWVWQGPNLPIIFSGVDILPTLDTIADFTVDAVMAMSQQR